MEERTNGWWNDHRPKWINKEEGNKILNKEEMKKEREIKTKNKLIVRWKKEEKKQKKKGKKLELMLSVGATYHFFIFAFFCRQMYYILNSIKFITNSY